MQFAQKNFYKKLLGRVGENAAVKELKKQGYKILERNYKTRTGEIDVIARDKSVIAFIEVKTRTSDACGAPSEAITAAKRRKYGLTAAAYLVKNGLTEAECRFDAVEVESGRINIIKDAFTL